MSKKKHPEHVNHERWLVSYADFITLLFAFFVVLFASGQNDKRKTIKLAQAMQSAFQYNGIFDQHTTTPPLSDDAASAPSSNPAPFGLPVPSAIEAEKLSEAHTQKDVTAAVDREVAGRKLAVGSVTIHATADGLVVSLREAGFFNSGSADVRAESVQALKAIVMSLPHQPMRVEGHPDDVPIHTAQFATNWELSTARAADITRLLVSTGTAKPTEVSASGFAEFRPVADNTTEAGRQQNRRVDIVLLKAQPAKAP